MHLIGGEFAIESTPGAGTTIRARVRIPTVQPRVASPEIVYSADGNALSSIATNLVFRADSELSPSSYPISPDRRRLGNR